MPSEQQLVFILMHSLVTFDLYLGDSSLGRIRDISSSADLTQLRSDKNFADCIGTKDVQFCLRNATPVLKEGENKYRIADIIFDFKGEPGIRVTATGTYITCFSAVVVASILAVLQRAFAPISQILDCFCCCLLVACVVY